ncbi:Mor transcription activator family protein [Pseudomonas citronellolis]|uniref:Mor transcription activator family protein n=1 Tax=Pseudomonas citronellolis TaxID=53408 RepID=UPI0023E3582D|nr:Mor transcription activator family protein [Pseudomonas citronellolis]MDF3932975.1 Mor transcription activator family protein [Pseudomonas citronellolis]
MKIRSQQIRRRNGMLRDLADLMIRRMERLGVSKEKATNEAEEIAFELHRLWAGITFTFPAKDELAQQRLKLHIIERYDGSNADDLVREFNVTEDWIYAVIREHHRSKVDKNQLRFDLEEPAD